MPSCSRHFTLLQGTDSSLGAAHPKSSRTHSTEPCSVLTSHQAGWLAFPTSPASQDDKIQA